jgi:hypothetical protein
VGHATYIPRSPVGDEADAERLSGSQAMGKLEAYRQALAGLTEWDDFLRRNSGLPGPRGNLELAHAVMLEGDVALFDRYIRLTPERAPENTPDNFLAFCGVLGQGRLIAEGDRKRMRTLRGFASDPRWRIREGVAMALQVIGERDMETLLREMEVWQTGNCLEQRAAAAALCEPKLLKFEPTARRVVNLLQAITKHAAQRPDRIAEPFKVLRQGLGYCWSVAVAAAPEYGKKIMALWMVTDDKDIQWIMRENLKKNRLIRCDPEWVLAMSRKLEAVSLPRAEAKPARTRRGLRT